MASAVAQAYNGGPGAEPPAGCRAEPLVGGQVGEASPPKLKHLVFGRSMKAANLAIFLKFGNAKRLHICAIFAKIVGGHETGGQSKTGGGHRPKTPTARIRGLAV